MKHVYVCLEVEAKLTRIYVVVFVQWIPKSARFLSARATAALKVLANFLICKKKFLVVIEMNF